jgi:hypothetical protein
VGDDNASSVDGSAPPNLELRFHGRVLDHLGIQMYHSPVAAIAELISNAWDADARAVSVDLPMSVSAGSTFVISDDGLGMTWQECQDRFLNVGYNRRQADPAEKTARGRRVMGRKGIGKFAGFGIAGKVEICTTSGATGERTTFILDIEQLRGDPDQYVDTSPKEIEVLEYLGPDADRVGEHGTIIKLEELNIAKTPNKDQFARSMARRFLLREQVDEFEVLVDGTSIGDFADDVEKVEFVFPPAYEEGKTPDGLSIDEDGWAIETLSGQREVRWQIKFFASPIQDEELAGIAVFAHKKLAQVPFIFNLTGGLSAQAGLSYMSGRVQADFIDELGPDLIATERQRVDWQHPEVGPLLEWGQTRTQEVLRRWQSLRSDTKVKLLEERLLPFAKRVGALPTHERRIVRKALRSIAKIETINDDQFEELASAILTAWEGGRLRGLIDAMAEAESFSETELLEILLESRVLTALHTAEAVKAKLLTVEGLQKRVKARDLENPLRDYIADNPWLINPKWETFQVEKSVAHVIEEAAAASGLEKDEAYAGRIDLVMSSGSSLLVLEFMRPGLTIDLDHVNRFDTYVREIRLRVEATTAGRFTDVHGVLVADKLENKAVLLDRLKAMRRDFMEATDWDFLLAQAVSQWSDYLELLADRSPDDGRMQRLTTVNEVTGDPR